MRAAAERARTRGALARRGDFYWPAGMKQPPLRDRSRTGPRDAELIPPEELEGALALVVRKEYRIARDELIRRAARLLGFGRTGAKLRQVFAEALEALRARGEVALEAGVVVAAEAPAPSPRPRSARAQPG
ncbi:MAG: DUF3320 domain-containing protein [Planctomycetota bacterium]|nr:MAG: DUF3320 domain-containing protein [Planctomycetota bacterium]